MVSTIFKVCQVFQLGWRLGVISSWAPAGHEHHPGQKGPPVCGGGWWWSMVQWWQLWKTGGLWWPMVAQVDGSSLEEAMQQIAKEYRVPAWGLNLLWPPATRNDNWAAEFGLSGHWPQGTVKPVGVVLDWTSTIIVDYGAGSPNSEACPSQQADPWAATPAYLRRGGWCFLRSAALPLHGVVIETCGALKCLATSCEFSWYMFERDYGLHFA